MGTKNNPGNFDCYTNANPDEPMFILLARDPYAPFLVNIWAALRSNNVNLALAEFARMVCTVYKTSNNDKIMEANNCAEQMRNWFVDNKIGF